MRRTCAFTIEIPGLPEKWDFAVQTEEELAEMRAICEARGWRLRRTRSHITLGPAEIARFLREWEREATR